MEIQNIQKDVSKDKDRSVAMSVRTSKEKSEYMKAKNISPSKLFNTALEELMANNPL